MKVLPRTQFGDPILRGKAKNVSLRAIKTAGFKKLLKSMLYTMRRVGGIGLAAPQIGRHLNVAVIEIRPSALRPDAKRVGPFIVINPRIVTRSKEKVPSWEGCLSFPAVRGKAVRQQRVTVEFWDENAVKQKVNATGLLALVFQHEIDHLNGKLFIDRIENAKTLMTIGEFKKRILKLKR